MSLRDFTSASDRRNFLEKETGVDLENLGNLGFDEKTVSSKNCENLIGAIHVPLGIAGPLRLRSGQALKIRNQKSKIKNYYIPLATTEGALVASVNRGCKTIVLSGGATTMVERVGTTRGPVYRTASVSASILLKQWLDDNVSLLDKIARKTSSHIKLKKLGARIAGRYTYVRFYFDTQDAMGMNMATIATASINRFIESHTHARCVSVAGNFDIDKKPSWLNSISGRGFRAWAEVVIPHTIVKRSLKTESQKLYDIWLTKCMIGSAMSGSIGFNAHYANIIAALFIATGQDPAHVVEGSNGITTVTVEKNGDLYCSVYMPSLMVGTVGGGTGLSTQKKCLEMLGCLGNGKVEQFARIVAGAVLAGEISLLASLAEGSLARAHQKLGR